MMVRLTEEASTSTAAIKEKVKEIGKNFDVIEDNIVENSDYLLLTILIRPFIQGWRSLLQSFSWRAH